MSDTKGGTALKPFNRGGSFSGSAGSAGISITLRTDQLPFLPPSSRCHIPTESESLLRIGCGPKLEHHLLLRAQVNFLQVTPLIQVPDVQPAAILSAKQQLRIEAVLHHVRCAPLGTDQGVVPKMPPEIVSQILRAALLLPWALQLKRVGIHQKNPAGAIAAGRTERAAINAVRATVDRVGRCVARLLDELFRFDHLHDLGVLGVSFRIQDVNPRRPDARNDKVTTLHMRMRLMGAEARGAR